jgi:hypothetical protein
VSTDEEITRFVRLLVQLVRDRAIDECDRLLDGGLRGPRGERWQSYGRDATTREALRTLIPDVVDDTLAQLLNAVENDLLPLAWQRADGSLVALTDMYRDGMVGPFMDGTEGWRGLFSAKRFFDSDGRLHSPEDGDLPD